MENANLKEEYNHLKIVGCQMPSMPVNPPDVTLGGMTMMNSMNSTEAEMLAEAAMLREHRARLENRMTLLEEHNRQLESQLGKLKQILEVRNIFSISRPRLSHAQTCLRCWRVALIALIALHYCYLQTCAGGHSLFIWFNSRLTSQLVKLTFQLSPAECLSVETW